MKNVLSLLLFLSFAGMLPAQPPAPRDFDVASFNERFRTVEWIYDYEMVSWAVTDSIRTRSRDKIRQIDRDWFCYQDRDSVWHAVYGNFDGSRYQVVFFFTVDTTFGVREDRKIPPQSFLVPYAKAIETAYKRLTQDHDSLPVVLSHYIRKNSDGTFTVWFFPAMLQRDMAVYGGEFSYTIDPSGTRIISSSGYYTGRFKGFPVDKGLEEIRLDYSDTDTPPLGAILFVWEYKPYFKSIKIETSHTISSVLRDHGGGYYWVHVEK
jgi:hypothetical protein